MKLSLLIVFFAFFSTASELHLNERYALWVLVESFQSGSYQGGQIRSINSFRGGLRLKVGCETELVAETRAKDVSYREKVEVDGIRYRTHLRNAPIEKVIKRLQKKAETSCPAHSDRSEVCVDLIEVNILNNAQLGSQCFSMAEINRHVEQGTRPELVEVRGLQGSGMTATLGIVETLFRN